jgi:hypothetical protein
MKQQLNTIHILKEDHNVRNLFDFKKNQEFHVINDVVYIDGHPASFSTQRILLEWIKTNPMLFMLETRHF